MVVLGSGSHRGGGVRVVLLVYCYVSGVLVWLALYGSIPAHYEWFACCFACLTLLICVCVCVCVFHGVVFCTECEDAKVFESLSPKTEEEEKERMSLCSKSV